MGGQPPGALHLSKQTCFQNFDNELSKLLKYYLMRLDCKKGKGASSMLDTVLVNAAYHDEKLRAEYQERCGRDPLVISPEDARHKCEGFGIKCSSCKYNHLCSYSLCMRYEPSDKEKVK